MNRKVYLLSLLLILMAVGSISAKVIYGGHTVSREFSRYLWRINIVMNLAGKGTRAKVRLTLPKDNERQTVYNEHFENDEMVFYIRERELTKNRVGFWRSELLDGTKSIQYTFSAQLKSLIYTLPGNLRLPDDPYNAYPPEFRVWLDPSTFIQSQDLAIKKYLKKIVGKEKNAALVMRKLYDFVTGQVRYRSEKGSKDAKATLNKLTADCGGQSRLFAALSRAAGVPSRIVGGLILTG
ncbi:MAG: transglutaminase domain-containing protein, partial [Candidatus Omnitrophica bacterium]|nr:transglutaminase domain-containing protein [Candidatus Omnitrophota bacterium]